MPTNTTSKKINPPDIRFTSYVQGVDFLKKSFECILNVQCTFNLRTLFNPFMYVEKWPHILDHFSALCVKGSAGRL